MTKLQQAIEWAERQARAGEANANVAAKMGFHNADNFGATHLRTLVKAAKELKRIQKQEAYSPICPVCQEVVCECVFHHERKPLMGDNATRTGSGKP